MSTTPSPADVRQRRTLRIAQLRQRVIVAAVATFALAFALVASDGSMGSSTKTRATAPAPSATPPATDAFDDGTAQQQQPFDDGSGGGGGVPQQQFDDGGGSNDVGGSSADPVQTGQS
jgi:uncharacterized membrane protein YgcG